MKDKRLHIFKDEHVYNLALLAFLHSKFELPGHHFIFLNKPTGKTDGLFPGQIFHFPGLIGLIKVILKARKCKAVFFHSLPMGPPVILWAMFASIFKKAVWIYWGADVYTFRNRKKNIKHFIYHLCRKRIIKKIPHIAGFLYGDFILIKEHYLTNAQYHYTVYQIPTGFELMNQFNSGKDRETGSTLKVLLGNSASETNLHIPALKLLSKFRTENMEVVCPLSYGIKNKSYLNNVIRVGKELFGDRFKPILNFMEPAIYARMISGIDIAIMNHNRQEALGNIISLLYAGKKVYLDPMTTSFEYFRNLNVNIYDIREISHIDFKEFSHCNHRLLSQNASILSQELSQENYRKCWENVLKLA